MPNTDVYPLVQTGFRLYFAFFNTVAREIGLERALALQNQTTDNLISLRSQASQGNPAAQNMDARSIWSSIKTGLEGSAYRVESIEESPQRVKFKCTQCPIHGAAQAVGVDSQTNESICRVLSMRMVDATVKRMNPNLGFRVTKFRSSPQDFCEEEIA